jgi:NAD-dependent histone deacetylase SIR2
MFDKDYFLHDPSCFFSFAKSIFPSNFIPSPSHRFIKLLEDRGSLLRNYTQNIDTLEQAAGIEKVLYCHGSFSKAQCTTPGCEYTVPGSVIKPDIFAQRVPQCPSCAEAFKVMQATSSQSNDHKKSRKEWHQESNDTDEDDEGDELKGLGVLKPCITFFGEKLSDEFDHSLLLDRSQVDLLIVMGTSLKVAPVSELVGHIPHQTPVILINKTPILHMGMDIQLLGDSDEIVKYLCNRLKLDLPSPEPNTNVVGGQNVAKEVDLVSQETTKSEERLLPKRFGQR